MVTRTLTLPELALIAGTRGMLGAGLGLLFAGRFSEEERRAIGRTLLFVGLVTTVPLLMEVFGREDSTPARAFDSKG
jgi:hypothetical protein